MSPQIVPSEPDLRSNRAEDAQALEEDARLRNDIRLLGRILGDTVRDQEGAGVFDLVERIRQTSIRFHRDDDKPARRELEIILDSMSTSQTVRIVRAFSYFSHLANIAEDQHLIRRSRAHAIAGSPPREGRGDWIMAASARAGAAKPNRKARAKGGWATASRPPAPASAPSAAPGREKPAAPIIIGSGAK